MPTAAAVHFAQREGLAVIASGGLRTGLDVARAIALGASVGSAALPFLRAAVDGGESAVVEVAERIIRTLKTTMLLTGAANLDALRSAPRIIGSPLREWLD